MKLSRLSLITSALCTAMITTSSAQNSLTNVENQFVIKANARTVIVDVVVTGRNGQPVMGLHKEAFSIAEDGHAQTVTSFEEHSASPLSPISLPALPPDVFSNIPRVASTDSVTVLLIDSLNTPLADQAFVHAQVLKYLEAVRPGRRYAIFALGRQLRYVQGFTDDPALLAAAFKSTTRGTGPQSSPMLTSYTEKNAGEQALSHIAAMGAGGAAAAAALGGVLGEQHHFQEDQRVLMTLDAFQQLARYLSGIPGRKNLVWFSSAFPVVVFTNPARGESFDIQREYGDKLQQTDTLLAAAQVAIYPIAAEGLATDSLYEPAHDLPGAAGGYGARQMSSHSLKDDASQRNADHTTMEEIANDTGGEAVYNTNNLNDAIERAADHGSRYYTLSYTPTNSNADGQFRRVKVSLSNGGQKLAYRRGYYAAGANSIAASEHKTPIDPLLSFMVPGLPASTQIPFALRVQLANSAHASERAGDNASLKGPLVRYGIDLVIAASGLRLDPTPAGGRQGRIEATVIVYDQEGKPLNWLVRQLDLSMERARYAEAQKNGINFSFDIDVPKNAATLRSGVYDWTSRMTGTLEVPLANRTSAAMTASSH